MLILLSSTLVMWGSFPLNIDTINMLLIISSTCSISSSSGGGGDGGGSESGIDPYLSLCPAFNPVNHILRLFD